MCDNAMLMKTCEPIAEGTPPISGHELEHLISHTADWEVDGYDTCMVAYTTHSIGGLSENDFICAANVDHLVGD